MVSLSVLGEFLHNIVLAKLYGIFGFGEYLLNEMPYVYWGLTALLAILAYLLGSVNFAVVISKVKFHDDIRLYGSHNAGFTNMKRVYGNKAGFATLAGDLLKNVVATGLTFMLLGEDPAYIAGFACILGHCYPVWHGFKGGKGVASAAAMILVLEPVIFLIIFAIFALMTLSTKYLSLGSISGALLFPILLNRIYNTVYGTVNIKYGEEVKNIFASPIMSVISVLVALFIIFKHRSNIKRIWSGTENKFYLFKKKEKKAAVQSLHTIDDDDDK